LTPKTVKGIRERHLKHIGKISRETSEAKYEALTEEQQEWFDSKIVVEDEDEQQPVIGVKLRCGVCGINSDRYFKSGKPRSYLEFHNWALEQDGKCPNRKCKSKKAIFLPIHVTTSRRQISYG
jgi:hypothetical protein